MTSDERFLDGAAGETITAQERRELVILVERPEITITWTRNAAGERGPDLHVHRRHTDSFYVLEGELTFEVGPTAERIALAAGGFVSAPPNVAHTYLNDSDADACWLNFHTPDTGFADYLRALRDGTEYEFDTFDPPRDGGRPASDALLVRPGGGPLDVSLPGLRVMESRADGAFYYALEPGGRALSISTPSDELEPPIRAMLDATNSGDSDAFLAAFDDDAELVDWGRTFTGRTEIARWNDNENIGVQSHIDVTSVARSGSTVTIGVAVSGSGYNGGGSFAIDVDGDRITRVVISG
jgi:quercetin dioxygenase-like cupin family protein